MNKTAGESIVFLLLRKFDYESLDYLFHKFRSSKRTYIHLNYFNQAGDAPLYLALQLYNKEKTRFKENNIFHNGRKYRFLYEYLLANGSSLNDSLKRDILLSPLWFSLTEIGHNEVCLFSFNLLFFISFVDFVSVCCFLLSVFPCVCCFVI